MTTILVNNTHINDIYNIKGDIVKEQLYEERTCSEEFDGIPLNNEPTKVQTKQLINYLIT